MKTACLAGISTMLVGAAVGLLSADAAVSAILFPHGPWKPAGPYFFLAGCGTFLVGMLMAAVGGYGWFRRSK